MITNDQDQGNSSTSNVGAAAQGVGSDARRVAERADDRPAFQRMDAYIVAKEFARRVHFANIKDAELRDQATRAAKSAFNNTSEGLPQRSPGMRRRHFQIALGSLCEAMGSCDLAGDIAAMSAADARAIQQLGTRLHKILHGLLRR